MRNPSPTDTELAVAMAVAAALQYADLVHDRHTLNVIEANQQRIRALVAHGYGRKTLPATERWQSEGQVDKCMPRHDPLWRALVGLHIRK